MKRGIASLIAAGVVILVILLFIPLPVKIEKTIPAVEIALDDRSFCQPVSVIVKGTYFWRIIGADTYSGSLSFEPYALTMQNSLVQTDNIPALKQQDGGDSLDYGAWMDSRLFGYMSWKPFLSKFVVQVYVPMADGRGGSWSESDGHCIVGTAKNRDEALKVLKGFSNTHLPPYEYWLRLS